MAENDKYKVNLKDRPAIQALRDRYNKMKDVSNTAVYFRLQQNGVEITNRTGDRMLMLEQDPKSHGRAQVIWTSPKSNVQRSTKGQWILKRVNRNQDLRSKSI